MSSTCNINTAKYWDEVYRREWEDNQVTSGNYHRDYGPIHDAIIRLISPGSRVLDVACGPGILCVKIKQHWPGAAVTGIDFSSYTIGRNEERDAASGIDYRCLDIRTSLGSIEKRFDVITMCEIIEHLDDPVSTIRDAMGLLERNGLFILSCPHAGEIPDPEHVRQWDHESLFHLLAPYSSTISFTHFPPPYFQCWMLAYFRKGSA